MGWTKLHGTIIHSSIWQEDPETKVVWITMLAMADATGTVYASVGGLAHAAGVTREACQRALDKFLGPDPDSRDGTTGERIEKVDGGWFLLNHSNYREKQTWEQEKAAARQQKWRDSKKQSRSVTDNNVDVTPRDAASPSSASASGLSEGESTERGKRERPDPEGFDKFWEYYGLKTGRKKAIEAWRKINPDEALRKRIHERAARYHAACLDADHPQKHPTTWLNGEHWTDEDLPKPRGNGRVQQTSKEHIRGTPLGHHACKCPDCSAFKERFGCSREDFHTKYGGSYEEWQGRNQS